MIVLFGYQIVDRMLSQTFDAEEFKACPVALQRITHMAIEPDSSEDSADRTEKPGPTGIKIGRSTYRVGPCCAPQTCLFFEHLPNDRAWESICKSI